MRFRKQWLSREERLLCLFAVVLGVIMTAYVYRRGLTTALTDQSSHLNFARLTFDSLTPGISQIGFWPPLLHILMIIPVAIPFLYLTGLAGPVVLIPFLALAAVFLYRTAVLLTKDRRLGVAAGLLFLLNPYVLYYASTPMMEVLLMANVFAVAYFTALWLRTANVYHLIALGMFLSLACLSRFEGLVLLPIVGVIVLLQLMRSRRSFPEIEAILTFLALTALIGVLFIIVYSWIYGGSPLAFTGGSWLRDPEESYRVAQFHVTTVVQYALHASYAMLGKPLVIAGVLSAIPLFFFRDRSFERASVLLVLISPLLFVCLSLFLGSITINVPDLPPYGFFHNDRYALSWIGFVVLTPLLLYDLLRRRLPPAGLAMWGVRALTVLVGFFVVGSGVRLYRAAAEQDFETIRRNVNSPVEEQMAIVRYLQRHYDYGLILGGRVDNDPILARAGIPLNRYIYEGNFQYFNQALKEPWLFARWVLMHSDNGDDPWVAQNESVYRAWGNSPEFADYYELVLQNSKRRLYRLKDEAIEELVAARKLQPVAVPALQSAPFRWNPETVYADMTREAPRTGPLASGVLFRQQMRQFYEDHLRPEYERGFYVDADGKGNSESQSYALLQSLWMDDRETFDRVWQWTRQNLQRPDKLFSWKFAVGPDQETVRIEDRNSATDADQDIAYALLLASERWSVPVYKEAAVPIIQSIWDIETAEAGGWRHVIAGNWAGVGRTIVINPSYFSPAAYRLFAEADPAHNWHSLIRTGYDDITAASAYPEDKPFFLPTNWIEIDKQTGELRPFTGKDDYADYSYDAFRTLWRVALDDLLHGSRDARKYLRRIQVFDDSVRTRFCTVYFFRQPVDCQLNIGTLAGPYALWSRIEPELARQVLAAYYLQNGVIDLPAGSAFYEKSWYWHALWLGQARETALL